MKFQTLKKSFSFAKDLLRDAICFIEIEMTDPDPRIAKIVEIAVSMASGDL